MWATRVWMFVLTSRNSTRPNSPNSITQLKADSCCRYICAISISSLRKREPILKGGRWWCLGCECSPQALPANLRTKNRWNQTRADLIDWWSAAEKKTKLDLIFCLSKRSIKGQSDFSLINRNKQRDFSTKTWKWRTSSWRLEGHQEEW